MCASPSSSFVVWRRREVTTSVPQSRLRESEFPDVGVATFDAVARTARVGETAHVAGYSGTPLPKKLGIAAGVRLALVAAPADFADTLGPMPDGVRVNHTARGRHDVIVFF